MAALLGAAGLQPEADEDRDRLGDATLCPHPFAHGAWIDAEVASCRDLREAEPVERFPELLGGHRHGEGASLGPSGRSCKLGPLGL
jgi:hypothetical protein